MEVEMRDILKTTGLETLAPTGVVVEVAGLDVYAAVLHRLDGGFEQHAEGSVGDVVGEQRPPTDDGPRGKPSFQATPFALYQA